MTRARRWIAVLLVQILALGAGLENAAAAGGFERAVPDAAPLSGPAAPAVPAVPALELPASLLEGPAAGGASLEGSLPQLPAAPESAVLPQAPAGAAATPALAQPAADAASAQASASPAAPQAAAGIQPSAAGAPAAAAASAEVAAPSFAAAPSGARAVGNRARLTSGVKALLRFFSGKKDPGADEAASSAVAGGSEAAGGSTTLSKSAPRANDGSEGQPPVPPAGPSNGGSDGSHGVWRNAVMFISGLLVAQVGIEAWTAAWAKWVQTNYGLEHYSTVTITGMLVSLAAGYAGGWLADKLGVKKTFITTYVLFAGASAGLLFLFHAGALTFPLLLGIYAARTFINSANSTAQQTIPIAIFQEHRDALEKFNSISQFLLEIAGITVPFMIGTLLAHFGSIGTMAILPIVTMAATGVFLFVKMGDVVKKKAASTGAVVKREVDDGLRRLGMFAYPALVLYNVLLYSIIAIGYGNFLHPAATALEQAAAAGVAGKITSLYSLGGLLAAAVLSGAPGAVWGWISRKLPAVGRSATTLLARFSKADPEPLSDKQKELKSLSRWMMWSALGLAGFIPMLWTSPMLAAAAMIPFGFTNVMSTLLILSLVQKNAPQEKKGKVMGLMRTSYTALGLAGMYAFTQLFRLYPASTVPFMVLLGLSVAIGAYYLFLSRKLAGYAKKTGN